MDTSSGITPVMPIGGYGDGFAGGGSFMWIFGLLILLGLFNGGIGGFGNNAAALGYENLATSNEVQRGFDNQNSMAITMRTVRGLPICTSARPGCQDRRSW